MKQNAKKNGETECNEEDTEFIRRGRRDGGKGEERGCRERMIEIEKKGN